LTDEIDGMLDHEQFDLLHFHEPWVPVLSRQILSRSQTTNVATFHAKLPETMMSRTMGRVITPYTKPLLRHIDAFTAVSDAAADYLLSLADVPVEIVPNGIDLQRFRTATAKDRPAGQPKTVLFIGRLEQRKGVKYLLDAFAQLQKQQPDVHLLIAGAGSERETRTFELQAQELALRNVKFLGFIDEATKQQLLHTADLFCSPALYGESFGIVLVEAMASGLVTVAGDNPGYASVMQGLGNLSLVNPKDISQFAHRLELLLYDEDLRALWKKWAKTYVQQFDWPKVVDRYEIVYKTALQNVREKN
jgi:phosphatidylinositol alpha-mannosyltransferase